MPDPQGNKGASGWGGLVEEYKHRAGEVLVAWNKNLEPVAQQLKAVQQESRRVADLVDAPVKNAIRRGLRSANAALEPIAQPLKTAEASSRREADKFER